ncbi:MAG TPA: polysaccharide biosynthesis tyrosine autokinase [Pyrinomonadaceae bacterium]|jgi:capsular exopolysaccharide synthesis family protein
MMSQNDRLIPLPAGGDRTLERPLGDLAQTKPYGKSYGKYGSIAEPTNLREYLFIVLKRKWLILSLVLVVTSLVTIHMFRQPNVYEAATMIQIEQKQKSVLQTQQIVINAQNDPAYWATQLKLLESPALARQVALTLDLKNNPTFFSGQAQTSFFDSMRRIFSRGRKAPEAAPTSNGGLAPVTENEANERQLTPEELAQLEPYENAIAGGLTVDPVVGTNLVRLRFKHTSPEIAQKVSNTLATIFVFNNLDRQTSGSKNANDILSKQIAELQLKIQREQEERMNYALQHNLPTNETADGGNLELARLGQLSTQLLAAENDRKNAQSIWEAARSAPDIYSVPEVQSDSRILRLREQIEQLNQKRAALLVIYTKDWPEVQKIDEQLKPLEAALQKAPQEVIASLKSKYEAAVSRENMLRQEYNRQKGTTTQQNADQIQMTVLNQNLETDKQMYNTLLQRQKELMIVGTDKPNNVSVAETARLPREPIGPARMRYIVVALLLALSAGIGLAFLLDYLDDTLKSVEDVDRYIHLPALALIPASRGSERTLLKGRGPDDGGGGSTALALIDDVRSPIAESYRHLRTSLLLSSAGQPPRSILVTSSQPSEGKTTTAVNTAVMLAQTGVEVIIIDCDLRRPRVHAHFNVPNVRGVTNYLSGESDLDGLMQPYEKLPNLKLLTSGPVPPNPAELLGSEEMRKLLNKLSERFTHIVIDSPPTISFTDSSILSTVVDGVILVVHGGRSSRAVVRRAKQQLMDVGANIFGVVLNNVKLESQSYYYAGYYSSYYEDADESAPDIAGSENAGAGDPR